MPQKFDLKFFEAESNHLQYVGFKLMRVYFKIGLTRTHISKMPLKSYLKKIIFVNLITNSRTFNALQYIVFHVKAGLQRGPEFNTA